MESRAQMEGRRLLAAEMLRGGARQAAVANLFGVSRATTSRWADAVRTGKSLARRKATGRPSRLTAEQVLELHAVWGTRDKWTSESFALAIRVVTGVHYDPDHVSRLIVRMGLREKRTRRAGAQTEALIA
jgi:transposase